MTDRRNIVLVGFMGTGKTSTGLSIAEKLGRPFVDMDAEIERREGRSIPDIFANDGEPRFREIERALVRELAARDGLVISPGGGIVLNPDNIRDFHATGYVVCLRATPETILKRVGDDPHRPLLQAPDRLARIRELLAKRAPLYDAVPHPVETDGLTPAEVADLVIAAFRASCPPGP